jgi:DNA-binding transcriptional MerR regulator
MPALTIGRVAQATGSKVQTIRYYEQIGLLPAPERSRGNQRLYDDRAVERLAFIRHARGLGFSLDAIRDLLDLADRPDRPCDEADAIARAQLG